MYKKELQTRLGTSLSKLGVATLILKTEYPKNKTIDEIIKSFEEITELFLKLEKEPIVNKTFKRNTIHKKSQAGQILEYMQKYPEKEFTGSDFMGGLLNTKPFIGYSASARLSELKKLGLVEKVGKIKGVKTFLLKSKDRNLYKITEEGMKYKLK